MADPPATADDDASLRRWEVKCEGMPTMSTEEIERAASAFKRIDANRYRNTLGKDSVHNR
jgi:hypothetical protein